MAAATVASTDRTVVGNKRLVWAILTAPADTNTWDTGLSTIDAVTIAFNSASTVAADSYGYTKSGGTITFELAGTARDICVTALGN